MIGVKYVYECDDTWLGRMIRWFTFGRVNHVGITYDSVDWGSRWVAEALHKGTVARPVRGRKWAYVVTPKYDAAPYLRMAEEFMDRKYDYKGFFLFVPILLAWRWFKLKIKKPTLSGKAQICSELAAHTLIPVLGNIGDPQWIHPEELLQIQEEFLEYFEVVCVQKV